MAAALTSNCIVLARVQSAQIGHCSTSVPSGHSSRWINSRCCHFLAVVLCVSFFDHLSGLCFLAQVSLSPLIPCPPCPSRAADLHRLPASLFAPAAGHRARPRLLPIAAPPAHPNSSGAMNCGVRLSGTSHTKNFRSVTPSPLLPAPPARVFWQPGHPGHVAFTLTVGGKVAGVARITLANVQRETTLVTIPLLPKSDKFMHGCLQVGVTAPFATRAPLTCPTPR